MRKKNQRGDILIGLIIAIIIAGVLGAGIYSLTTTSSFSEILDSNTDSAYELAKSGIRMGRSTGVPGTFNLPDANHTFTIAIVNNGTNWVITSTGTVNTGLWQTQRLITYAVPTSEWLLGNSSPSGSTAPNPSNIIINGPSSGGAPWGPNTGTSEATGGSSNAVTVNTTSNTINLGGAVNDSYGSIWYNGTSLLNNCDNGACSFGSGSGLYVYFEYINSKEDYTTTSTNSADGFTFAVISSLNNRNITGGAPNGISMGELMGYAGPGNSTTVYPSTDPRYGLGIVPPKMAIEFDTFPNTAGNLCSSANGGSRNDHNANTTDTSTTFRDHAALIFWGASSPSSTSDAVPILAGEVLPSSGQCTIGAANYPDASFDDNVHGAGGTGGDPQNSSSTSSSGYYEGPLQTCNVNAPNTCNWLKDGYKYSIRIEINRLSLTSFTVNVWVLSWNPNCSTANTCFSNAISPTGLTSQQILDFQDVLVPFTDNIPAQIAASNITIPASISGIYNAGAFNTVFFGFTEATGEATQSITLGNINAFFPSGCKVTNYSISSAPSQPIPASAGSYSFKVVAPGCPWIATTNVTWITFPSTTPASNSGNGNGTVSWNVSANSCPAERFGYIHIPGQDFMVTQSAASAGAVCSSCATTRYTVENNYGHRFYVEGGTYGACTPISNGSTFFVNCSDTSAVNVYSNNNCSTLQTSVSFAGAAAVDTNGNGIVEINSSDALVDD